MCGIIGIASNKSVTSNIINSLKKLEYRGYDSAGIATIVNGNIDEKKCTGRVDNLEKILFKNPSKGSLGIGHVRWATHGIPSQVNAHPHSSEEVSVVHNGIIENSNELKKDLENKGYKFKSETDTEVITFLLTDFLKDFDLVDAINKTLKTLNGSCSTSVYGSTKSVILSFLTHSSLNIAWDHNHSTQASLVSNAILNNYSYKNLSTKKSHSIGLSLIERLSQSQKRL